MPLQFQALATDSESVKQHSTLIICVAIVAVAMVLSAFLLRPQKAPSNRTCTGMHGYVIPC